MEKFDLHILGCGSALPTTRHYNTSQVLNIREKLYMIDCGEGTQIQFRRTQLNFRRLGHIFISHLHGDHCFGLPGLISTFGMLGRTADLHIHAPAPLQELMAPQLAFHCPKMDYQVIFHEVDTTRYALVFEDHSIEVYSLPLNHRIPCCGYLFKEKPRLPHIRRDMIDFYKIPHYAIKAIKEGADAVLDDGTVIPHSRLTTPVDPPRCYAYCSDTLYKPELSEYLQGTDLLFHEATFSNEHLARAQSTCHSTASQAAEMAVRCRAKRLLIGHFSARYTDETVLLDEARQFFPNTLLAHENMRLSI